MRCARILGAIACAVLLSCPMYGRAEQPAWSWYEVDANRDVRVNLYLFWSTTCPHCPSAVRYAESLAQRHSWLNLYSYEITGNAANRQLYQQMAASLNQVAGQTPAFFYGKRMQIGYNEPIGQRMEQNLVRWYEALRDYHRRQSADPEMTLAQLLGVGLLLPQADDVAAAPPEPPDIPIAGPEEETLYVPGWGNVDANANDLSLPVFTLVIAGCDAFNPCAFFVLLLLLSLLVHGQSRLRMFLVGGVFVFFSALVYFLFMAAWLNLFLVIGHMSFITATAAGLALIVGLLNVKDFYWFKQGPSLSIPEDARPGLFRRMTHLINASHLTSLLVGAAALAFTANLYELLCTSGFPMIYIRVLTLRQLPVAHYYGYLVLYNLVYVFPMALLVMGFTLSLGARKLTEYQGRVLKLLSGTMMLALGLILLFRQEILHTAWGAAGTLLACVGITALFVAFDLLRNRRRPGRQVDGVPPQSQASSEQCASSSR